MNLESEVLKLLDTEKFCCLGTSYKDQPHISLMNFTYIHKERAIILSSRKDTEKMKQMKKNNKVSILLNNTSNKIETPISCTIDGIASILEENESLLYRNIHLKKNKGMENFIIGDNIVIIYIGLKHVLVSNIQDKVWEFDINISKKE